MPGFPDPRSVSSSSWEKPHCWARALVRSGSQEGRLRPLQLPRPWGGAAGRWVDGGASPPRGIGLAQVPGGGWCVHRNRANGFARCLQMPFTHMASPSLCNCSRKWTALLSHFTDERKDQRGSVAWPRGHRLQGQGWLSAAELMLILVAAFCFLGHDLR